MSLEYDETLIDKTQKLLAAARFELNLIEIHLRSEEVNPALITRKTHKIISLVNEIMGDAHEVWGHRIDLLSEDISNRMTKLDPTKTELEEKVRRVSDSIPIERRYPDPQEEHGIEEG